MKTINDIMTLLQQAIQENKDYSNHWFFNFSGHVEKMSVTYYPCGWKREAELNWKEELDIKLNDEDSIQCGYYWIKTRLNNKG